MTVGMSGVQHIQIRDDDDGMRLDRWLRARFPDLNQSRVQKLLRTGQVRVDGGRAKAAQRLAAGQNIRVPPLKEQALEKSPPRAIPRPTASLPSR
ncbi:MAG: hypothetical protein K8F25_07965 [Fimbriimonadaceae bacterium]|nr:hypothetical protein [Alphaproteobacteria bacterium]